MNIENLKYPIGNFTAPTTVTPALLASWIADIAAFPERLKQEVSHLHEQQLDCAYRPDGWAIRQVVHHCADSHMNSLIRFKLALTEERPIIKPYREESWAELADGKMPIASSLMLLEGLHTRWVTLLQTLSEEDLRRVYIHPYQEQEVPLNVAIGLYAWHGKHHLAHITEAKKRMTVQ